MDEEVDRAVPPIPEHPACFTSALSVNEFAACAALGLEPVQLVQGYAVLAPSPPVFSGGVTATGQRFQPRQYPAGAYAYLNEYRRKLAAQGYWKRYRCPHLTEAVMAGHLTFGANAEELLLHWAWRRGYDAAFSKMVKEAIAAGAHGIVGVRDHRGQFADSPALEYHVAGTAVRVAGAPDSDGAPWTTHLAGSALVNVIAGGYMPVAAVVDRTWVAVWPYCMTKFFLEGQVLQRELMGEPVQEILQLSEAKSALVEIAMGHIRAEAKGDSVYGIDLTLGSEHLGGLGVMILDATVRGTRLRRFDRDAQPLDAESFLTFS